MSSQYFAEGMFIVLNLGCELNYLRGSDNQKYPWQMVDYITIEDRNLLHKTTRDLLYLLVDRICDEKDNVNLSSMLLKRVYKAALRCPGFTQTMKDDVVFICGVDEQIARDYGVLPFASFWKYLWCVGPKPGIPDDYLLVRLFQIAISRPNLIIDLPSLRLSAKMSSGIVLLCVKRLSPSSSSRLLSRLLGVIKRVKSSCSVILISTSSTARILLTRLSLRLHAPSGQPLRRFCAWRWPLPSRESVADGFRVSIR